MIVLTGGAGFIGSNLLATLSTHYKVIVVDNLNNDFKHQNLLRGNICQYYDKKDFLAILPTLDGITAILHQGACSSTTETNETYLEENNVAYSKTLFHYAINNAIPFIYASSASVYGDGSLGFDDNSNDYYPINGYANSKLVFDKYVTNYLQSNTVNSKVIGLRYFNVYGFGEAHKNEMASVVYKFYNTYKSGNAIQLFEGSDAIKRDFIEVSDVVAVNIYCLNNNVFNGIYNVGTGKAASFQALADVFITVYADAEIENIPFPEHLKNKYQYFTEARIDKLRKQGYSKSFLAINEGVQKYLTELENSDATN